MNRRLRIAVAVLIVVIILQTAPTSTLSPI